VKTLEVLSRFSVLRELKETANLGTEHIVHFARTGEEELLARVGVVEALGGKVLVQMSWADPTQDAAVLPEVPNTPPETRFRKLPTEADDRFFDAAAVMFPAKPGAAMPSLQMGDTDDPVQIYYWNAARGPMLMEAAGRGTTRRTGASFAAHAAHEKGRWTVAFELPDLPAGTPLSFALWNGSQKDRDGRKYFSVWQVLQ
jgi:hypothetical protein